MAVKLRYNLALSMPEEASRGMVALGLGFAVPWARSQMCIALGLALLHPPASEV